VNARAGANAMPGAPRTDKSPDEKTGDASAPNVVLPTHFVAWFFDDVHIGFGDLVLARKAAEKFFTEGLKDTDRAAIFTTSGMTSVDFTDNLGQLKEGLARLGPHPRARATTGPECPDIGYYLADQIVNKHDSAALTMSEQETYVCMNFQPPMTLQDTEPIVRSTSYSAIAAGEFETKTALGSLKDLVRRMSAMPGQRLVVMISPGFLLLADQLQDQSDVIDRAIKAGVTISALDARGLYTDTPDITRPTTSAAVTVAKQRYDTAAARQSSDVMAELADGTGGTFFQNNNDLHAGMKDIAAVPEVYYILGFSPQNLKVDGSFHSLKVTVRTPPGLSLKARRGYYAPRHLSNADEEAKEEISEALFSREEMRDIPVEIHTQFFKPTEDEAQLSVNTRIDVRKLHYRKIDGRNGDELLVVAGLFDHNGNFLQSVSKKVSMRLKDETLAGKLNSGIGLHADFKVSPGRYVVRLVVRDSEGQTMAAQSGGVEIP
jgi:VWFA-related protein